MCNKEEFDLRKKFTENAKEFDTLMVLMLAENKRLKEKLSDVVSDFTKFPVVSGYQDDADKFINKYRNY